jgi:hypothetical protein
MNQKDIWQLFYLRKNNLIIENIVSLFINIILVSLSKKFTIMSDEIFKTNQNLFCRRFW